MIINYATSHLGQFGRLFACLERSADAKAARRLKLSVLVPPRLLQVRCTNNESWALEQAQAQVLRAAVRAWPDVDDLGPPALRRFKASQFKVSAFLAWAVTLARCTLRRFQPSCFDGERRALCRRSTYEHVCMSIGMN